jgi:hypothetical protein
MEIAREQNNDHHKIRAMLPANFPDRDDVVINIFETLFNGSLQRDQVKARIGITSLLIIALSRGNTGRSADNRSIRWTRRCSSMGATILGDRITSGLWD